MNVHKPTTLKRASQFSKSSLQLETLESRCLLNATVHHGIWTIYGDQTPDNPHDIISIETDSQDPATYRAMVNNQIIYERPISDIHSIRIFAGKGNDEVNINPDTLADHLRIKVIGGRGDDLLN